MSLIVLDQASLGFGAQRILEKVSLRLGTGEKIGLIGPNGSGKSTLLRIMLGQQALDTGEVHKSKGCRVGYLPQDVQELGGETLLRSVLATVPGRLEVSAQLAEVEAALELTEDTEGQMALATRLAELGERTEHFETWFSDEMAIRILRGLGFGEKDLIRPTSEFSGGWKMRAALAGLLFQKPDVLFLDEPTNHLDIPSVLWLDRFMGDYEGAVVLICHDRNFLNRHCERVVSFEPEGLRTYTGNYESYLEQRATEEEVLGASMRNREKELKDLERFVERFKAKATKARQAQSRAKRVKRMRAELEEQRPASARRKLNFRFPEVPRSGRNVVELLGLSKAFGELRLYEHVNQRVSSGERIAIVGVNGAGKTTLLRMLAGELAQDDGEIRFGSGVELGYYAQHHSDLLSDDHTVLEEVRRIAPAVGESALRGICGAFLFSRDEVDKVVGVLSGGERARVLLARLLVRPGNLLLMDEPTNHLDLAAAEALATALESYGGTLIFVSHNITFVNRLATSVWDIVDGDVVAYPGNLDEYLDHRKRIDEVPAPTPPAPGPPRRAEKGRPGKPKKAAPAAPSPPPERPEPKRTVRLRRRPRDAAEAPVEPPAPTPTPTPPDAPAPPEAPRRKRRRRRRRGEASPALDADARQELETRIADLRTEMKALEADLADPSVYGDAGLFQTILGQFNDANATVERLEARLQRNQ